MLDHFALFPPNGLDRSLHTAVLIGLAVGTLFTETLGWTYAGLVVPGYLATVLFAAPITGAFIVFESIVTYLFVALIGRWITRTGVWSTAFGRERFYLFIVGAVFVRLVLEGSAVPQLAARYGLIHSRELYSVGLVLVPLVANAFWNSGLARAGPRLAIVTALTAIALGALLQTTNLSVSRFQVLNESLSLEFLQSPKAHIILVIGALLGARNNVLYGWDYNGILVPGLLAVAWYEPTKLLTTTVEALLVYLLSRGITSMRPFSRMLLVGPRRMLFVYVIGYMVKLGIGFGAARFAPGLQMIDYFGFGYLLPSLLAVKMWNKERVGVVLMPTIQVSLTAFLAGNGLGYAMVVLGAGAGEPPAAAQAADQVDSAPQAEIVSRRTASAALALVLADTVPRPGPRPRPAAITADVEARRIAYRAARDVLEHGAPREDTRANAEAAGLLISRVPAAQSAAPHADTEDRPWYVLSARLVDAEDTPSAPRAAFRRLERTAPDDRGTPRDWLVVAAPPAAGSALPAAALAVAEALDAAAVVLLSRHEPIRHHDEAFAVAMADAMSGARVLRVNVSSDARVELSVVGSTEGLPVVAIGRALGAEIALGFRSVSAEPGLLADAPRLTLPHAVAEAVGAALLGAPDALRWPGRVADELQARMLALTSVDPGGFRAPSIEELRLFDAIAAPRFGMAPGRAGVDNVGDRSLDSRGRAVDAAPTPWERAVLDRLGYRAVRIGGSDGAPEAWGLVDPGPDEGGPPRRGNPTWITLARPDAQDEARSPAQALLVEVPAPRWQIGAFGAALAIAEAASARAIVIAGALPTEDPSGASDIRRKEGVRSYYQRSHELWIGGGKSALSIQAIEADRTSERDAVITFGREVIRPDQVPMFARPLLETLRDLDLRVGLFDGTREQVPFSGAIDAGMAYAKRFAEGRFAIVYLGSALRRFFELRRFGAEGASPAVRGQDPLPAGERELRLEARLRRLELKPRELDVAARAAHLAACADDERVAGEACPTRAVSASVCDLEAALDGYRHYGAERNPYDLRAQLEGHGGAARRRCYIELDRDVVSGAPWAIAARPGEALLLPIDGAHIPDPGPPIPTLPRLRRAVTLGTSALRAGGAAPADAQPARPAPARGTP